MDSKYHHKSPRETRDGTMWQILSHLEKFGRFDFKSICWRTDDWVLFERSFLRKRFIQNRKPYYINDTFYGNDNCFKFIHEITYAEFDYSVRILPTLVVCGPSKYLTVLFPSTRSIDLSTLSVYKTQITYIIFLCIYF